MLHTKKVVRGTSERPRLEVFRSNKHLSAQLIDDEKRVTLFGVGTMCDALKGEKLGRKSKDSAKQIGKLIAEAARKHNVNAVVFDRGEYKYHGVIAVLADAAREAGLNF